jgi:hypothetical protein
MLRTTRVPDEELCNTAHIRSQLLLPARPAAAVPRYVSSSYSRPGTPCVRPYQLRSDRHHVRVRTQRRSAIADSPNARRALRSRNKGSARPCHVMASVAATSRAPARIRRRRWPHSAKPRTLQLGRGGECGQRQGGEGLSRSLSKAHFRAGTGLREPAKSLRLRVWLGAGPLPLTSKYAERDKPAACALAVASAGASSPPGCSSAGPADGERSGPARVGPLRRSPACRSRARRAHSPASSEI